MQMSRPMEMSQHLRQRLSTHIYDMNNPHLRLLFMHDSSSSSSVSTHSAGSDSTTNSSISSEPLSYSTTPSIDNMSFLGRHGFLYSLSSPKTTHFPSSADPTMSTNQIQPNDGNINAESTPSPTPQSAENTNIHADHALSQYHYHLQLLQYMQTPEQFKMTKTDATISISLLMSWCMVNMGWIAYSEEQAQPLMMNNLLLFGITIALIYRDLLICNGHWCLPLLLLFMLTIRLVIEFIFNLINIRNVSLNACILLIILLFTTQRFIFNIFVPQQSKGRNVHWDLLRCQVFYRGAFRRWMSFAIYAFFMSVMIMQLMDSISVCFGKYGHGMEVTEQSHFKREGGRRQFVLCDAVLLCYAVGFFALWQRLKTVDHLESLQESEQLKVKSNQGMESLFLGVVFWMTYILWDTVLTWYSMKDIVLQATVLMVLLINSFVM